MDAATIDARIYAGRGKAALRVGYPCRVLRPATYAQPLSNLVTTLNAAFNATDSNYAHARIYGKPEWYVDVDGRFTQAGDYLFRIKDGLIWFIAAQQSLLPIIAIECNRTVYVSRRPLATSVGQQPYSSTAGATPILGTATSMWPCSIVIGGRALPAIGLPDDVKEAGWRILLPVSIPEPILSADFITDDLGRTFSVESAELTQRGWRLTVNETHP